VTTQRVRRPAVRLPSEARPQAPPRTTAPPPRAERPRPARMPRLPGLDGVRAIAVTAVVLYHLDLPWIPGGFLGVDVFFALSGFLITTLVIEEIERDGRLDVRRFYLARARRLLPALWLVLAFVCAVTGFLGAQERSQVKGDVTAALLYVSNWWYVVRDQSYFQFVGRPDLSQHLWSLAVEEQFYLLWPAVLVAAMLAGRTRVRRVALWGALASTALMATIAVVRAMPVPTDPSRVYFGTDTHAMGLFVGAALATVWSPWRRHRRDRSAGVRTGNGAPRGPVAVVDAVGLLALVVVGTLFLRAGQFSTWLYRGGFLLVALVAALLVAAAAQPTGLLARCLAVQPLRWIGERSYGIYLWHWPIFMVTRPGFELGFGGVAADGLRVGLTLLAAEASYRFVERPIRAGAVRRALGAPQWRTPQGRASAFRLGAAVASSLAVLALLAGGLFQAAPTQAAATPPSPAPSSSPTASVTRDTVSAFGDSVLLGASDVLRPAGVHVYAAEGERYALAFDAVHETLRSGRLGETVVLHVGNNGVIAEGDLRTMLDALTGRRVFLVNLYVPRAWERYNNALFAKVAPDYPYVHLLDWHDLAQANPAWLYSDRIHLTPAHGRAAYSAWLLQQLGR